jgi:hypothetical protein
MVEWLMNNEMKRVRMETVLNQTVDYTENSLEKLRKKMKQNERFQDICLDQGSSKWEADVIHDLLRFSVKVRNK